MRIGKKSKEGESRSQVVDGINRLICTSKSQSHPLTGLYFHFTCTVKYIEQFKTISFFFINLKTHDCYDVLMQDNL